MKKIVRVQQQDLAPFNLTWTLSREYSWPEAEKFINELKSRHAKIRCSITDDSERENSLLPLIVDAFDSDDYTVSLTTSGNINPVLLEKMATQLMWICFNYRSDRPSDSFFTNLDIAKQITRCGAKVAMLPDHWDDSVRVFDDLRADYRHETDPDRISNANYSQQQLDWFNQIKPSTVDKSKHIVNKKFPNAGVTLHYSDGSRGDSHDVPWFINNELTNFTRYTCEIGLMSMYINQYGIIKRGLCEQGEILGQVNYSDNINWPTAPITCTAPLCRFATDVRINKWATI